MVITNGLGPKWRRLPLYYCVNYITKMFYSSVAIELKDINEARRKLSVFYLMITTYEDSRI
jgi:hypothetical protein